ncbi:MAG: carboxypeptidase-like regulatory domain-containing protein [Bacteroidales bacterium]
MKKIILYFLLFQVLFCLSVFGQQPLYLKGQVFDVKTNSPIPFVTITYGKNLGVITNDDGSFIIPIISKDSIESIKISSIGYEQVVVQISKLDFKNLHSFHLNPKTYEINEVTVKGKKLESKSAHEIVSIAVNRIGANYPKYPFLLNGYYRDYLKIDNRYINLFEAAVDVEDLGFHTNEVEQTKIGLIYGALNKSFVFDYTKVIDYGRFKVIPYGNTIYTGGNEFFFLLRHDPIRNFKEKSFDFIKYIQSDFLIDHKFKTIGIEYIDEEPYYKIEFKYKTENNDLSAGKTQTSLSASQNNNYKANGYIYVKAKNYEINKLTYQVYYNRRSRNLKLWELNLEYRDRDGIPYLNYISFNNMVEMPDYDSKKYFYIKSILIDKQDEIVKLIFNNRLDSLSVLNIKNYKLDFDGNRMKVEHIGVKDSCVNISIKNFVELLGHLELEYSSRLNVKVKNIKDCYGNTVNDVESVSAYQYREFFVNDVHLDFQPIPQGKLLDPMKTMIYSIKKQKNLPDSIIFNSPLIDNN